MRTLSIVFAVCFVLACSNLTFAQCTYIIRSATNEERLNPAPDNGKPKVVNHLFTLPSKQSFKITSTTGATSDYDRTGDYMAFSVAENVYVEDAKKGIRCTIIPKDTRVFGRIDHVKQRTPFNINGKAQVYVYVDSIKLDSGLEIPIKFVIKSAMAMSDKKIVRPCKNDTGQDCITGRRSRRDVPNDLGQTGADIIVNHEDADNSTTTIVFTAIGSVLSSAGLGVLLNRPDAKIKAGQIFDVEVTKNVEIWLELPKDEEVKPGK